ncbi:glycine cleavage system H protein [Prevotella intermedia]|uniref:Glycine cleavage system H protein n=1 Tax=Prevotella intermedia TaxID=28131 RepID=A0A2D3NER0_PREIN|nr:glycine cleavage system H protein [Prevotella intermedia]
MFVVIGKGSSGLLWTKEVGSTSRYGDNLHFEPTINIIPILRTELIAN